MRRQNSDAETITPWQHLCFCILGAAMFCAHVGVCKKPPPVSDVVRPDRESRDINRPEGVAVTLHFVPDLIGPSTG